MSPQKLPNIYIKVFQIPFYSLRAQIQLGKRIKFGHSQVQIRNQNQNPTSLQSAIDGCMGFRHNGLHYRIRYTHQLVSINGYQKTQQIPGTFIKRNSINLHLVKISNLGNSKYQQTSFQNNQRHKTYPHKYECKHRLTTLIQNSLNI